MYQYKILKINTTSEATIMRAEKDLDELATDDWDVFHISSKPDVGVLHTVFLRREMN